MTLFRPNINSRGRLIRGIGALTMITAAILLWPHSRAAAVVLALSAVFVGFEALRGWCALRACGLKTKI